LTLSTECVTSLGGAPPILSQGARWQWVVALLGTVGGAIWFQASTISELQKSDQVNSMERQTDKVTVNRELDELTRRMDYISQNCERR
jgi:hypothetical protein